MKMDNSKITPNHLARKAIIYLRQSTPKQVKQNQESQRLQYALADRAKNLGFTQIEVIDIDLGVSASIASHRIGFKQLLASVALGEVGIVMSRELSRLSRTDKDWCHLLEVCQIFNTLIGDAEQIYDLMSLNDQLILGIKGTMSVAELKVLQQRMHQGKEAKALRGELFCMLAPGYIKQGKNQIIKDPDQRVQEALSLVFSKFLELSSIRQTYRWFITHEVKLPTNKYDQGTYRLNWKLPTPSFIANVLHNPLYAGAYVYGRRPVKVRMVNQQIVKSQQRFLPLSDAKVFIKDHHSEYISWQTYERIQRMIENNGTPFQADTEIVAVRQGQGLLTGLLRCGHCGRKLQIRYYGKAGTTGRYLCPGEYQQGGDYCIGFGSLSVDRKLSDVILKILSPMGLSASLLAQQKLTETESDHRRALRRELQQLEYEAQRAFHQFDQADPHNRLVTQTLEERWNQKLEAIQLLQDRISIEDSVTQFNEQDKQQIAKMSSNFDTVWHNQSCSMELKKRICRTIIEEIIVESLEQNTQLSFIVHWKGSCHTQITMDRPRSAAKAHKTNASNLEIIQKMACYSNQQIAQVLCRLGHKTGKGNRWNKNRVAYVRNKYKIEIKSLDSNILSLRQAMSYCKASDNTIKQLIEAKIISANQAAPYAPLEINQADLDSPRVLSILKILKATGKLYLEGYKLDNQRSLFDENQ